MHVLKDLCHSLNKTVVVVTHDSRILPIADRVLKLADGRIASNPPPGNPPSSQSGPYPAPPIRRSA
jgi:ABC-type lipoprotein export system ATPase subunit